jgi:hypothetical protein
MASRYAAVSRCRSAAEKDEGIRVIGPQNVLSSGRAVNGDSASARPPVACTP